MFIYEHISDLQHDFLFPELDFTAISRVFSSTSLLMRLQISSQYKTLGCRINEYIHVRPHTHTHTHMELKQQMTYI